MQAIPSPSHLNMFLSAFLLAVNLFQIQENKNKKQTFIILSLSLNNQEK